MADAKTASTPPATTTSSTVTCNLQNPTRGARVIHDGIDGSNKKIFVAPGDTVKNVTISKSIADELIARNRTKRDSDLRVLTAAKDETEAA